MSFTMKTAAATVAAAFVAVAAAKAQEVEFDSNQVGEFTRQASLELSIEIAAPTTAMRAASPSTGSSSASFRTQPPPSPRCWPKSSTPSPASRRPN